MWVGIMESLNLTMKKDYEDSVRITTLSLDETNSDRRQKASSPFINPQSSASTNYGARVKLIRPIYA